MFGNVNSRNVCHYSCTSQLPITAVAASAAMEAKWWSDEDASCLLMSCRCFHMYRLRLAQPPCQIIMTHYLVSKKSQRSLKEVSKGRKGSRFLLRRLSQFLRCGGMATDTNQKCDSPENTGRIVIHSHWYRWINSNLHLMPWNDLEPSQILASEDLYLGRHLVLWSVPSGIHP